MPNLVTGLPNILEKPVEKPVSVQVLLLNSLSQILGEEINKLRMAHSVTVAKISEHKRKQIELSHRVLKVSGSWNEGNAYGLSCVFLSAKVRSHMRLV